MISIARAFALLLTPSVSFAIAVPQDTVVRSAGAPKYPGVATLVQEVSVGVIDGAEEYMFGDIADIAVGKDGAIYVLDRSISGIRMYDSAGKYLRTIGRRGQGPGEMMSPSGITTLSDGRLLLWETGLWRVNVYTATGAVLTHWSLPTAGGGTAMMSRAIFADTVGDVYVVKNWFVRPTDGSRPRVERAWLKLRGGDGSVADTIREPAPPYKQRILEAQNGGSFQSAVVPFDPVYVWKMSPHGYIVSGFPDRYAFEIHTRPGLVTSIRRDVQGTPVTNAERDSARRAVETSMRQTEAAWSWGGVDLPKTKPPYADLAIGLDGRIWVARVKEVAPSIGNINGPMGVGRGAPPPPRGNAQTQTVKRRAALYDVFEPTGAFIGSVEIPPGVSTVVRRGDYIWGVAYDEDDVAFVRRYRISWK